MELVCDMNVVKLYNVEDSDSAMEVQYNNSVNTERSSSSTDRSDRLKKSLLFIENKLPIDLALLRKVSVTMNDFMLSLKRVQPSSKREGFATIPDVTWDDVGSLKDIREELQLAILVSS